VLLEDDHKGPGLLDSNAVLEEVQRQYGPHVFDGRCDSNRAYEQMQ
jgi:hypothetical protein